MNSCGSQSIASEWPEPRRRHQIKTGHRRLDRRGHTRQDDARGCDHSGPEMASEKKLPVAARKRARSRHSLAKYWPRHVRTPPIRPLSIRMPRPRAARALELSLSPVELARSLDRARACAPIMEHPPPPCLPNSTYVWRSARPCQLLVCVLLSYVVARACGMFTFFHPVWPASTLQNGRVWPKLSASRRG